jgi:TolA-binding protein
MVTENKGDVERELAEIRKEVIESRNLVIKTDNLLKNLHAELKLVGKRQDDFQLRQWINSGVSYALFAAICVAGAIALSSTRVSSVASERDRLEKQVSDMTAQLNTIKSETSQTQLAQRGAADVYRQMTTLQGDQRLQGIDALVKLEQTRLSTLEKQALADRAELLRKEIGQSSFEKGKTAFRRGDMQATVQELARFLAMNPSEEDALDASYHLGVAYSQLRKHDLAIPLLERSVANDKRSKNRDYAMLMLATSYEAMGQLDKAADTARDALGTYAASEHTTQLRIRLSSVKRAIAAQAALAPAAPTPGGQVPPAAPTPVAPLGATPTATTPAAAAPAAPVAANPGQPR